MKHTFKSLMVPVAVAGVLALPTLAQAKNDRTVNQRQNHQEQRIQNGERNGSLTAREAAELQARQARIRQQEAIDRQSGGKFTPAERADIQRRLNHASDSIHDQKHDSQNRDNRNYNGPRGGSNWQGAGNNWNRNAPHAWPTPTRHSINWRQQNQQNRIRNGENGGSLTRHETADLEARRARINAQEAAYRRSGGQFTPAERAQIQRQLDQLNADIYRQKHDSQHRH